MQYNYAFDIAFEVLSDERDWGDIPTAQIRDALLKRVEQLDKDAEWKEATSSFDVYEIQESENELPTYV